MKYTTSYPSQTILKLMHDYYREHRQYPRRITVSQEVARELDAEVAVRKDDLHGRDLNETPQLCADGCHLAIKGIPVIADLDDSDVIDVREL